MYALNNLALYVQTELNDIAQAMYLNNDITHKIVFYVTDSEQNFDDVYTNMEYAVNDEIKYTPVLLKRIFATKQDDYVYGKFLETYRLEVLAYLSEKTSVELIFDRFTEEQNQGDYDIVEGSQVKKSHSLLSFSALVNAKSGTNAHFVAYNYEFTWDYVLGSVISDATSLSVDGVVLDFLGLAFQNEKVPVANISYGTNVLASTNGMTYAITFPILKGVSTQAVKNKELFDDITLNRYNKTHTLSWVIDDYKTVSITATVKSGTVVYNRDDLLSFVVVFEQALPRTTVTIDSVALPVLSFAFQRDNGVESIITTDSVKSALLHTGYTVTVKIAHDHSIAKSRALLTDLINPSLTSSYTLGFSIGSTNTIAFSDTVILKGGNYQFEQTGELIYEVTFVKVV